MLRCLSLDAFALLGFFSIMVSLDAFAKSIISSTPLELGALREAFEQNFLERSTLVSRELPSLGAPTQDANSLDPIFQWLIELLNRIGIFSESAEKSVAQKFLNLTLDILVPVLLIFLLWVFYRVYSKSKTWSQKKPLRNVRLQASHTSSHILSDELRGALELSDYSLAARLRWKIFLATRGVDPTLTPVVYSRSDSLFQRCFAAESTDGMMGLLCLMFGNKVQTRSRFDEFESILKKCEATKELDRV